jgi:hypothetical protein
MAERSRVVQPQKLPKPDSKRCLKTRGTHLRTSHNRHRQAPGKERLDAPHVGRTSTLPFPFKTGGFVVDSSRSYAKLYWLNNNRCFDFSNAAIVRGKFIGVNLRRLVGKSILPAPGSELPIAARSSQRGLIHSLIG